MASKKVLIAAIVLLSANLANCGRIVEIQTMTGTTWGAGMDALGQLNVQICSGSRCCQVSNLNNQYDNFEEGYVDKFRNWDLKQCQNFYLRNGEDWRVKVSQ